MQKNKLIFLVFTVAVFSFISAFPVTSGKDSFWEKRTQNGKKAQGLSDAENNAPEVGKNKPGSQVRTTDPQKIYINPKYASIKEFWLPQGDQSASKLIVYIQDAHCNYEAQKNSAHIIEDLIVNYGLKLVMVEGATGNANLSYLRKSASPERRIEVAERYLKEGKIAGEEYLDLISDYEFKIEGVENEDLYGANLEAFFAVEKFKDQALNILKKLELTVKNLKTSIYNQEMKDLEKAKSDFDTEKIKLVDFYKYIYKLAEKKGVSLNEFKNFQNFGAISKLEEKIVFSEVEKERDKLISFLTKKLAKKELRELIDSSLKFKQNKLKAGEYYSYLENLGKQNTNFSKEYPNLELYVRYVTLNDKMETMKLFKEEESVIKKLMEGLSANDEQKQLSLISERLALLINFVNLQLSPDDYKNFKTHSQDYYPTKWYSFLEKNARRYNYSQNLPYDYSVIERNFKALGNFYEVAEERDAAFIKNIDRNMENNKQNFAALITGGFHADQIADKLKEKNYAYVMVAPKFGSDNDAVYLAVMKEKGSAWLEKWREKRGKK